MPLSPDAVERFNAMEAAHPAEPPQPATSPVTPCKKTWVAVELFHADGQPFGGARYVITLPDGGQRSGTLDQHGYAIEKDIGEPGQCQVAFPGVKSYRPR